MGAPHHEKRERRQFRERIEDLRGRRDELLFLDLIVIDNDQVSNREAIRKLAPAALAPYTILAQGRPGLVCRRSGFHGY